MPNVPRDYSEPIQAPLLRVHKDLSVLYQDLMIHLVHSEVLRRSLLLHVAHRPVIDQIHETLALPDVSLTYRESKHVGVHLQIWTASRHSSSV